MKCYSTILKFSLVFFSLFSRHLGATSGCHHLGGMYDCYRLGTASVCNRYLCKGDSEEQKICNKKLNQWFINML